MHTFFINTSKRALDNYKVLFDVCYENKTLITLNYDIRNWYDEKDGYSACVKQMGELIDTRGDLDNLFNLVVFIDLTSIEGYTSIEREQQSKRDSYLSALYMLFIHTIKMTVIDQLREYDRLPKETLIMFGEDKRILESRRINNEFFENQTLDDLFELLGIPKEKELSEYAQSVSNTAEESAVKVKRFKDLISDESGRQTFFHAPDVYPDEFDLMCTEIMESCDVKNACKGFFKQVKERNRHETIVDGMKSISCPIDCKAEQDNKSVYALNRLNIACYLLSCVNAGTLYETNADGKKIPRPFREYSAIEFAGILEEKRQKYSNKYDQIESIKDAFHALQLVPELYELDCEKFGLNEYGEQATRLVETRVEREDQDDADPNDRVDRKEIVEEKVESDNLLSDEGYRLFRAFESPSYQVGRTTKPEEYIHYAKELRRCHLDYLQKLKFDMTEKLSRYSGRSDDNSPEMLRKRRVSKADREFGDKAKEYPYAERSKTETKQIKTIQTLSENAYATVLQNYMEFCAGRSVAITDIEEQCNWFITKIRSIQAALQRIKMMIAGMLAALIVLYVPYILLQWPVITSSTFNIVVAAVSVVGPIIVLLFALGVVIAQYKRKYRNAWDTLMEKNNEALSANAEAVETFDRMLCSVIPTLRWVYEYKLDVDFYADCCAYAKAKLNHHIDVLKGRVKSIGGIVADLETEVAPDMQTGHSAPDDDIDYNVSFCTGKKNCAFYTVIDPDFLKTDRDEER